jgi:ABC-type multidrug transport system fused ATPase/permease subunit
VLTLSRELNRTQERMALLRGLSNALAALFTSLAGLTVLVLGIPLVSGGQIDGVYLALLPLTAIASFEAVQPLSLALQQLEANQAAGRRLFELIDAPPEVSGPPEASATARPSPQPADYGIEIRDLTFGYRTDEPLVLDSVNLTIPAGGRALILGPSGSGKSTIVNLLLRFWDYHAGEIKIGGHDLHEYCVEDVRQMLGVVSQQVYLFNATVQDNLLLANPDATDEQICEACRQAQLHDFIETLPLGYDTLIGENGVLLSGGERQRLAIARVILKNAPVLILDEATANLDAITEQKLLQSLESFMSGRTVIIISHRRLGLKGIDHVVELENGHVLCHSQ